MGPRLDVFYSSGDQSVTFSVTEAGWRGLIWGKSAGHCRPTVRLGGFSHGRIRDRANTIRAPRFSWGHLFFEGRHDTQQDCHRISSRWDIKEQAFVVEQ